LRTCLPLLREAHGLPIAGGAHGCPALIVRNVEAELVATLEQRAAREGVSAEELHRRILKEALRPRSAKERMLEALEGLAWDDPEFRPERAKDTGREVEP
jgi:plasmid stability protein